MIQSSLKVGVRVREALSYLGLTDYEAKAYLTLLADGPLTARKISGRSSVPYSKVYDVLKRLKDKGWIEAEERRPALYHAKAPVEASRAAYLRFESLFNESKHVLLEELQPIFEGREVRERPEVWIIRGEGNVMASVLELLSKARRELLIALPWRSEKLEESAVPSLRRLKEGGVKISILTASSLNERMLKDLGMVANVKVMDGMFGGGMIVDGKEAIILLSEGASKPTLAICSSHAGLTYIAKVYFDHLWAKAKNL